VDLIDGISDLVLSNLKDRGPKMECGPSVLAVQKELLWKYLDLMILQRKGFFSMAMFQAT
jgi:hypothetical protein